MSLKHIALPAAALGLIIATSALNEVAVVQPLKDYEHAHSAIQQLVKELALHKQN